MRARASASSGFVDADRQAQLEGIVRGTEGEPLDAPGALVGSQVARLDDAIDPLHARRGLDLRDEIDRALGDAALALERGEQPVDRVQVRGALHLGKEDAVHALVDVAARSP